MLNRNALSITCLIMGVNQPEVVNEFKPVADKVMTTAFSMTNDEKVAEFKEILVEIDKSIETIGEARKVIVSMMTEFEQEK